MALTAGNAFFVAAEFSLVTVDRAEVDRDAQAGDPSARTVRKALRQLTFQLSGAQLGITITALLTGYLAEPALATLFRPIADRIRRQRPTRSPGSSRWGWPRCCRCSSVSWSRRTRRLARPMRHGTVDRWANAGLLGGLQVADPVAQRVGQLAGPPIRGRAAGGAGAARGRRRSSGLLAAYSAKAGALPEETAVLLRRTIRFADKRAAEAMTPRVDVVGIAAAESVQTMLELARQTGKSRFPVYVDTLDSIVGVITVIDAFGVPVGARATTAVGTVAREPVLVPESLDLDGVLAMLQQAGADVAIVVDEYGGTDGMVTIEDLVEELVGDIADEHDAVEPILSTLAPGAGRRRRCGSRDGRRRHFGRRGHGRRPARGPGSSTACCARTNSSRSPASGCRRGRTRRSPDSSWPGSGHIPVAGETVEEAGWEFTVIEVERRRVERVRVVAPETGDD